MCARLDPDGFIAVISGEELLPQTTAHGKLL
jgi:hypothetical protein